MIDLLGFALYLTILAIGLLDLNSGLGVFAPYRPVGATTLRRGEAVAERRDDGHRPTPPTPAR